MNTKLCSFSAILSLSGGVVFATVPVDLMYNSKPIDALCFFDRENDSKSISLKNCGFAKEKYVVKGQNNHLIAKGYIGYNWQNSDAQNAAEGYSYYKIFKAGKGQYWLYTINSGGGSGEFSTIYLVKRKNPDTLEIQDLAGGDRCNGGVQAVSKINNELHFSVNLTAYDLIALSKKPSPHLKAYEDLAACAVCCVAKAFYQVTLGAQPQLKYVNFQNLKETSEMPEQGAYQACFNQLFTSYAAAGKSQFKQIQLDEFADKFNETCIKK